MGGTRRICNRYGSGEKSQEKRLRIPDPEVQVLRRSGSQLTFQFNVFDVGGGDMGKAKKIIMRLVDDWPRWAGVICQQAGPVTGPPGSGKTTFMKALFNVARTRGVAPLWVRAKDCGGETFSIKGGATEVRKKISSVLQFTSSNGFRPAFDALATAPPETRESLPALREWAERRMKPDIATWVAMRLETLERFVQGEDVLLPLCLSDEDELVRRLVVGMMYVLRGRLTVPVLLDDVLAFVLNDEYRDAFIAMMRPFVVSLNRYLDTRELLAFSPLVVPPDRSGGIYRFSARDKYVIYSDFGRYEISLREVQRLAEGA